MTRNSRKIVNSYLIRFWSEFSWDSQQGRDRKTSILVLAFWNFQLKVLKYQWNFWPHASVISKFGETPMYVEAGLRNWLVYKLTS